MTKTFSEFRTIEEMSGNILANEPVLKNATVSNSIGRHDTGYRSKGLYYSFYIETEQVKFQLGTVGDNLAKLQYEAKMQAKGGDREKGLKMLDEVHGVMREVGDTVESVSKKYRANMVDELNEVINKWLDRTADDVGRRHGRELKELADKYDIKL